MKKQTSVCDWTKGASKPAGAESPTEKVRVRLRRSESESESEHERRPRASTDKMQNAVFLLLTTLTVLHGLQHKQPKHAPESSPGSSPGSRPESRGKEAGLTEKLLRLDGLLREENDVMEPKRKRGFTGNSAPLDRLSVGGSSMESTQSHKNPKVSEPPRKKASPPPIDRIGAGRLPGNKG